MQAVDAAGCDATRSAKAVTSVNGQRPELFVVESRQPCCPGDNCPPVGQPGRRLLGRCLCGPSPELHGNGQTDGLGGTDAAVLGQLAEAQTSKATHPTVLVEQRGRESGERRSSTSGHEQDGQELGIAQRVDAGEQRALLGGCATSGRMR